jgi:hypothetical protein
LLLNASIVVLAIALMVCACYFATFGTGQYTYSAGTHEPDTAQAMDASAKGQKTVLLDETIPEDPDSTDESLEDDFDLLDGTEPWP